MTNLGEHFGVLGSVESFAERIGANVGSKAVLAAYTSALSDLRESVAPGSNRIADDLREASAREQNSAQIEESPTTTKKYAIS